LIRKALFLQGFIFGSKQLTGYSYVRAAELSMSSDYGCTFARQLPAWLKAEASLESRGAIWSKSLRTCRSRDLAHTFA